MTASGSRREKAMSRGSKEMPAEAQASGRATPSRPRILLADADPESLLPLVATLTEAGMTTLTESRGQATLDSAATAQPDLIVLDRALDGLDGFVVADRIRQNAALSHIPVLFRTEDTDPQSIVRGFSMGAVDYVSKRCSLAELLARIEAHLRAAAETRTMLLALDAGQRPTIGVRPDGSLLWYTPAAASLLSGIFVSWTPSAPLPPALATALDALARPPDGSLCRRTKTVKLSSATGSTIEAGSLECTTAGAMPDGTMGITLQLRRPGEEERRLATRHNLTTREAQVLFWISRGKSNRDISELLGTSARTVNKHLEQIFAKLGVENRASAAVIAVKTLSE
ncbi:response regulator [Acidomonas methanolica]|nr:response regulator [Acidomonas methanolica]